MPYRKADIWEEIYWQLVELVVARKLRLGRGGICTGEDARAPIVSSIWRSLRKAVHSFYFQLRSRVLLARGGQGSGWKSRAAAQL